VKLEVFVERFALAQVFAISRGRKTEAVVVRAVLSAGGVAGQGECVPYARYGETVEGVVAAIVAQAGLFAGGMPKHEALAAAMPAGAARNALDCALWDFRARRDGPSVAEAIGLALPETILTCVTLSLDTPEAMAQAARETAAPLLKLKLGGDGDAARMRQVRAVRPEARLVVDANEGWAERDLAELLAVAAECGVELVEQPLPAGNDGALADIVRPVPVCADESAHGIGDLDRLADRYDAINVKLDKAGGADRSAGADPGGTRARLSHHDRLDGGHEPVDAAGGASGGIGGLGGSGWAVFAGGGSGRRDGGARAGVARGAGGVLGVGTPGNRWPG
jgi:L-alanine-DL-glutamate epimerase-like enolase superfamily enzyme